MNITIRKFEKRDIPNKVKWINDPQNNFYLHYDLPLEINKTEVWFDGNENRTDRFDAVIEVDECPVGLIGLLSIDKKNKKAEYYVTIGEQDYKGKGVAKQATIQLLKFAFSKLKLNRVYLYTEVENIAAVRLYERLGFKQEGLLVNDLFSNGRFVDRYIFGVTKNDFYHRVDTPIQECGEIDNNRLYIKRDDLIPYSFGGNKARKAQLFFEEIDSGNYDCVVTYGSSSSNHCRIIANMAAARHVPCYIVSSEGTTNESYNRDLMDCFGAEIIVCSVEKVHDAIENKLTSLKEQNRKPYFIAGGGHGNIGTQAYVNCYEEIRRYEVQNNIHFDYIFHASGTGTTQAGLICGQLIHHDAREIIGISIARRNPMGRDVVIKSVDQYLHEQQLDVSNALIEETTIFIDDYVGDGYRSTSQHAKAIIDEVMIRYGIPLDTTYTGKAFVGMLDYVKNKSIVGKNILFVHTGGMPLFFDDLEKKRH